MCGSLLNDDDLRHAKDFNARRRGSISETQREGDAKS